MNKNDVHIVWRAYEWRYESIVLTIRIAGKQINIKKIKLFKN